jgi:hypothetical protein
MKKWGRKPSPFFFLKVWPEEVGKGEFMPYLKGIWQSLFPCENVHCFLIIAYGG